ncbi:MAG: alpha-1,4-glucan--maltose-1-phosphate maltosyltransferase [Bacteroidetes bacterium]|nr:MAG: alpha-1,4-glucan--maltose-1-phosphate maltosyltransferase [Bacteroidota bacterium]
MKPQNRVIIENVTPEIDGGKYPAKRVVGQYVDIKAYVFADGHDVLGADVCYRHESEKNWQTTRLTELAELKSDIWVGRFLVEKQGYYYYKVRGWVDHALNWQHGIEKKVKDGQRVHVELWDGVQYIARLQKNKEANTVHKAYFAKLIDLFESAKEDETKYTEAVKEALSTTLHHIFEQYPFQQFVTEYDNSLSVYVDRKTALFSALYEFFPRSASQEAGKHGTFKDCERLLPRVADMGFDTLYFPPVHPIGVAHRKGKNNATTAQAGDVGSPWAIGGKEGGHKDIHPELGTLEDFKSLIKTAESYGIEVAMDYALQCSPDHPYVTEHPAWFKWRPDGTVQYAENPPKKYQDILPIYFETEDWKALWDELLSILLYWCEVGIKVFRVDNPHTKAFVFWEWAIAEVKKKYPDTLFLSEAFTRPKVTHKLAKAGFTQAYTYYTWRNSKQELIQYMTELTQGAEKDFFRPNFWPNTPDINPYILQGGNEALMLIRYFMAATLSSNYGVYGPVYEFNVHAAVPGKEEYLDSEKYDVKLWDWNKQTKISVLMKLVNKARRENSALQETNNFVNCPIQDEQLFAYYKGSQDGKNHVICAVNLDPYNRRGGTLQVPIHLMNIAQHETYVVHDILTGNSYHWRGEYNFVELDPYFLPFHLFVVERLR